MSPNAKTPSEEMYAFLRSYHLDQYHPVLIKLVDNLDSLLELADHRSGDVAIEKARRDNRALDWRGDTFHDRFSSRLISEAWRAFDDNHSVRA